MATGSEPPPQIAWAGDATRLPHEEEGRRVSIKLVPDVVGLIDEPYRQPESYERSCWRSTKRLGKKIWRCLVEASEAYTDRDYSWNSYGVFSLENKFRQYCVTLSESDILKYFLITYVCVNEFLHLQTESMEFPQLAADILEYLLIAFLFLEFVYESVALGLWRGSKCYFRRFRCIFNFFVLVVAIVNYPVETVGNCAPPDFTPAQAWYTSEVSLFFALTRNLRVLRLFANKTSHSIFIIFVKCLANLLALTGLTLIFVFFFFIVYFHTYGYTQFNRCYFDPSSPTEARSLVEPAASSLDRNAVCYADSGFWDLDSSQAHLCGSSAPCAEGTECRSMFEVPHGSGLCTASELHKLNKAAVESLQSSPVGDYGTTGFQSIFASLVSLLECVTLEGWTDVMYRLADGDDTYGGVLVYILHHVVVVLGNLVLMNLIVAVMWESTILETSKSRSIEAKKEDLQMYEILGMEWIRFLFRKVAEHDVIHDEAKSLEYLLAYSKNARAFADTGNSPPTEANEVAEAGRAAPTAPPRKRLPAVWKRFRKQVYCIVVRKWYVTVLFLVSAIDSVLIIWSSSMRGFDAYAVGSLLFFIIYTVDVTLQLVALGWRSFLRDGFKVYDLLIALIGLVEVSFSVAVCSSVVSCSAEQIAEASGAVKKADLVIAMLHSLRIFKVVRNFAPFRLLLEVMAELLHKVFFMYCLLLFFVYVFSTFGYVLFFDPKYEANWSSYNLEVTRYSNFTTIWQTVLLLFGLMTGESWNVVMREYYSVYRDKNHVLPGSTVPSNVVFSSENRAYILCFYLFLSVTLLCCFCYNVFGAVLIGQYVTVRKVVFNQHIFRFLRLCRELGIEMPTSATIETSNLQHMYSLAAQPAMGRKKSRRALSEFLRPRARSEALGAPSSTTGAAWVIKRLTRSISRSSTARRQCRAASATGTRVPGKKKKGFLQVKIQGELHNTRIIPSGFLRRRKRRPGNAEQKTEPALPETPDATSRLQDGQGVPLPSVSGPGVQTATNQTTTWAVAPEPQARVSQLSLFKGPTASSDIKPTEVAVNTLPAATAAAEDEELSLPGSLCYLVSVGLVYCCDALLRAVIYPFRKLSRKIVAVDAERPDAIVDFIALILSEEFRGGTATVTRTNPPDEHCPPRRQSLHRQNLGQHISVSEEEKAASLSVFRRGPVGAFLQWLVTRPAYEWTVAGLDVISIASLVVECEMTEVEGARAVFAVFEWVYAFTFLVEALLKLVAHGCHQGECLALRTKATRVSFVISVASCILLILNKVVFYGGTVLRGYGDTHNTPLFRLVKVFRSLRCIHLFSLVQLKGVRIVARSLVACMRSLVILCVFLTLVLLMFASIISQVMRHGYVPPEDPEEIVYTFHGFGDAWLGSFVLATAEGWPLLLAKLLDQNPSQGKNILFLVFLFISAVSIFCIKMCIGIIVDASRRAKTRLELEGSLLSPTVHKWIEIQELIFNAPLQHGDTIPDFSKTDVKAVAYIRKKVAAVVTHRWFHLAVGVHIFLCCIVLFFYGAWVDVWGEAMDPIGRRQLHFAVVGLSQLFFVEVAMKIIARGRLFFRDMLDVGDAVLCCVMFGVFCGDTALGIGMDSPQEPLSFWPLSFRLFRIARILYRQVPFFQTLFTTIARLAKSFVNVLTLVGLTLFFFGIWGVVLFSDAPIEKYFNRHANFKHLGRAIMVLVGSCTGEDWHMILEQLRRHYTSQDQMFLKALVIVFFISFIILVFFILMDLFTTTVLEEYMDTVKNENLWKISRQHRVLLERWNPKNEPSLNFKTIDDMIGVLSTVEQPIGLKHKFPPDENKNAILKYLAKYGLPLYSDGRVHIREVALNCVKRACEFHAMSHGDMDMKDGQVELNPRVISGWMGKFSEANNASTPYNLYHHLAANVIQQWFRRRHITINGRIANPRWCAARVVSFLLEARYVRTRRQSGRPGQRESQIDPRHLAGGTRRRSNRRRSRENSSCSTDCGSVLSAASGTPQDSSGTSSSRQPTPRSLTRWSASDAGSHHEGSRAAFDIDLTPCVLFEPCLLVATDTATAGRRRSSKATSESAQNSSRLESSERKTSLLKRNLNLTTPRRRESDKQQENKAEASTDSEVNPVTSSDIETGNVQHATPDNAHQPRRSRLGLQAYLLLSQKKSEQDLSARDDESLISNNKGNSVASLENDRAFCLPSAIPEETDGSQEDEDCKALSLPNAITEEIEEGHHEEGNGGFPLPSGVFEGDGPRVDEVDEGFSFPCVTPEEHEGGHVDERSSCLRVPGAAAREADRRQENEEAVGLRLPTATPEEPDGGLADEVNGCAGSSGSASEENDERHEGGQESGGPCLLVGILEEAAGLRHDVPDSSPSLARAASRETDGGHEGEEAAGHCLPAAVPGEPYGGRADAPNGCIASSSSARKDNDQGNEGGQESGGPCIPEVILEETGGVGVDVPDSSSSLARAASVETDGGHEGEEPAAPAAATAAGTGLPIPVLEEPEGGRVGDADRCACSSSPLPKNTDLGHDSDEDEGFCLPNAIPGEPAGDNAEEAGGGVRSPSGDWKGPCSESEDQR